MSDVGKSGQQTSVIVDLSTREAWALAELCKRIGWTEFSLLGADRDEAEVMRDAIERLRRGLADSGFAPR